jgi:hypothetical protein
VVGAGLLWAWGGHRWIQSGLNLVRAGSTQDTEALQEFVTTLAQVLSGVLGFTLSVVAIVVQLSADRFTPKVTELFLREKVNFYLFFFLILANVVSLWSSAALSLYVRVGGVEQQRLGLLIGLNLLLGTASFLVLIPYFRFVFHFLQPASIIHRIEQQVRQAVLGSLASRRSRSDSGSKRGYFSRCSLQLRPRHDNVVQQQRCAGIQGAVGIATEQHSPMGECSPAHQRCLSALDEIKSIATSALRQQEGSILLEALDSLKSLWVFYAAHKAQLPPAWFLLTPALWRDPDFASVDRGLLGRIEAEGSWLELKILRQYQALFAEGLNGMRQASTLVAIHSRELGIRALETQQLTVAGWVIKFFNTYLRAVINARDIRSGYNLLKQYRLLAEAALQQRHSALVLQIVGYFRYYSLIAYRAGLFFLSETFGFDLGMLAQSSCALGSETTEAIVQALLRLDQDPVRVSGTESLSEQQETTLRGIRKTQVRVAAYFLRCGREDLAKLIYWDMQHEPLARLQSIRQELQSTTAVIATRTESSFWEFTDRGENFYFLEPALQPYADQFFGWFQGLAAVQEEQGSVELP